MMLEVFRATMLMLALLNPFLVIVYLFDVVERLEAQTFRIVLLRAALISTVVFCVFAIAGELIFQSFIQAEFGSFQIFGGIIFLLVGVQFVFKGPKAIAVLRGDSEHLAGAIAMPVLIGPGSVSASIVIGKRLSPTLACSSIIVAVAISVSILIALKVLHDHVRPSREQLVERYIEIAGRITALYVGTISVDMIMRGISQWIEKLN